jgi:hypothetical protein
MAIEIKELVIKTILDNDNSQSGGSSSQEIQREVKKQMESYKAQIIEKCIEIISDGIKRQSDR